MKGEMNGEMKGEMKGETCETDGRMNRFFPSQINPDDNGANGLSMDSPRRAGLYLARPSK